MWKTALRRWLAFTSLTIFLIATTYCVVLSFRTMGHLNEFKSNLQAGASEEKLSPAALDLSRDIEKLFSALNFPGFKQILNFLDLDFTPIRTEIKSMVVAAPSLLGSESTKRYLVAFQNSAEARGTGGILGAYAIIEVNRGTLKVTKTGSNEPLYGLSLKKIPIDVPKEFKKLYGENPAILQNSNLSPHFPYGAEIWLGLWKEKYGEDLDGVIAVDPTALSFILRSTGPITLQSGMKITSENVVSETLKDAYKRYESDNMARKDYLVEIMNASVAKLNSQKYSRIKMAQAIRDGIIANRILMYSTDKRAEETLSKIRLGGYLTLEPNNEYRTVIQNIDASKLDYYLDRSVTIESTSCKNVRETQVRIRVKNSLKSGVGLPGYVLTRADKGKPAALVSGAHRFKVFIYGPTNSKIVSASRENRTANLGGSSVERKRPIYVADVDLAPNQSEELIANFSGGIGKIFFVDQPLVRETKLAIKDRC